jgi:hypothetical protein
MSQSWSSLGTGVNFNVYALEVDSVNDELYVGGRFTHAGGVLCNGIAKWNGTNWFSLLNGVNQGGKISAIFFFNGEIYVGGDFDSIGGIAANNIAKWNNLIWEPLSDGFNDAVAVINSFNGEIYVGGHFDSSGTQPMQHISKWNGNSWHSLNSGVDGPVYAITSYDAKMIIGGNFYSADSLTSVGRVAQWDGVNCSRIGLGFNNFVRHLYVFQNALYASGDFYFNGPSYIRFIANWDGSEWKSVTSPGISGVLSPGISQMINYRGLLHVTGNFSSPRFVAKYAGSIIDSLEHGLSGAGECFEIYKGDLIVGGYFAYAGNSIPFTNNLAKWSSGTNNLLENFDCELQFINQQFSNKSLTFSCLEDRSNYFFELFSSDGRLVKVAKVSNGVYVDIGELSSGVYIYRLANDINAYQTGKLLIY